MAGIPLTEQRRSQLLESLLAQQAQQPQGIRSVGSLAARLGAQLIRQKQIKKLQEEERTSQQELVDALSAGQATSGKAITLEDFEGGSGRQQIGIPGRKAERGAQAEAISRLSPAQQLKALEIKALQPQKTEDKITTKQFREGNQFVTREVINGRPGRELSRSNIDRTQTIRTGPIIDKKKINTEAIQSAQASAALRRNLTATIPEVEANKRSVGFRGQAGLGIGGFLTTFFGEGAGDTVAKMIAGNDQEQISMVLTRLQTLRAALIPILTGERSSRFSEPEREIANKAVGIIDSIKGPGDLARSFPQVIGAMKELTIATLENEFEQARISDAVEFPFDLSNKEGFIKLGEMLSTAGFTLEEAQRARDRLIRIQNL